MQYSVNPTIFNNSPNLKFGILIAHNIQNSPTTQKDEQRLKSAENLVRKKYQIEHIKEIPNIFFYREVMSKNGINPNRYLSSVEAMFSRTLKGGSLPNINAMVDLCNAVSLENVISLGAHDLKDLHNDLEIRFSKKGDIFLPFGQTEYENVDENELVFASGNIVQIRKWIWRQSELGKTTINSHDLFFQIVGFENNSNSFQKAISDIEKLITDRFNGVYKTYIIDKNNPSVQLI